MLADPNSSMTGVDFKPQDVPMYILTEHGGHHFHDFSLLPIFRKYSGYVICQYSDTAERLLLLVQRATLTAKMGHQSWLQIEAPSSTNSNLHRRSELST